MTAPHSNQGLAGDLAARDLPALPEPHGTTGEVFWCNEPIYSARQMVAYGNACRALATPVANPEPSGMRLVPSEPTEEMAYRGGEATSGLIDWNNSEDDDAPDKLAAAIYRAMLAAAPALATPTATPAPVGHVNMRGKSGCGDLITWTAHALPHGTPLFAAPVATGEPTDARAEIAKLREDKALLDFLDASWADGVHVEVCGKGDGIGNVSPQATVFLRKHEGSASTVREAIRAALAATKEQQ